MANARDSARPWQMNTMNTLAVAALPMRTRRRLDAEDANSASSSAQNACDSERTTAMDEAPLRRIHELDPTLDPPPRHCQPPSPDIAEALIPLPAADGLRRAPRPRTLAGFLELCTAIRRLDTEIAERVERLARQRSRRTRCRPALARPSFLAETAGVERFK